jgi:hypothetical protein
MVGCFAAFMLLPDSDPNEPGASNAAESSGQHTTKRTRGEEVNSEDAKSDGVLSAIAGEQRLDRDFADEINAVQMTLRDLEAAHTFEGSGFLHGGTTGWGAEIDDLHRRLVAVEESFVVPSSSTTSSNGETE